MRQILGQILTPSRAHRQKNVNIENDEEVHLTRCLWVHAWASLSKRETATSASVSSKINKNGHLFCEMGKKEQVPALAIFVQGSLWGCGLGD